MTVSLTRRERLRRAFFHEEMDRPAVYTRTGYPADDPTYDVLKAYMAQHSELKRGWHPDVIHEPWKERETQVEPVSDDWDRQVTILHTPAGDFRSSRLVSLRGQPGMPETYPLKTLEDIERWLSLPMPEIGGDLSAFHKLDAEMGDAGIIDVSLGRDPGGEAAELLGSETFAIMSTGDRDALHALCQRRMEVLLAAVEFLLNRGVGTYFSTAGQERIAPPLHGPRDFWDYIVKYDKPINDLVHERGGASHVHCHGALGLIFAGFIEMGVDVLHPVEPPPMGDLPAAKAKERAAGRLTIEGNIQTAHIYEHTPREIRAETEALIRDAFASDRKGLIVSTTASPWIRGAGESSFPMYKAMVDAAVDWRP